MAKLLRGGTRVFRAEPNFSSGAAAIWVVADLTKAEVLPPPPPPLPLSVVTPRASLLRSVTVRGLAVGTTTLQATIENVSKTISLDVVETADSVKIERNGRHSQAEGGGEAVFAACIVDGLAIGGVPDTTWTSSDPGIATVTPVPGKPGRATIFWDNSVAIGQATITATVRGVSAQVTVGNAPVARAVTIR